MNTASYSNMNICQGCGAMISPPRFKCDRCAGVPQTTLVDHHSHSVDIADLGLLIAAIKELTQALKERK